MKKLFIFLLAILFCTVLFCGCAKSTHLPVDSEVPAEVERIHVCRHLGNSIDNTWQIAENSWKLKTNPVSEMTIAGKEIERDPIPVLVAKAFSANPAAELTDLTKLRDFVHFRIYDISGSYKEYYLFEQNSAYFLQYETEKAVPIVKADYRELMNLTAMDSSPLELSVSDFPIPMLWHEISDTTTNTNRTADPIPPLTAVKWAPQITYTDGITILHNGSPYTEAPYRIYQNGGFMFDPQTAFSDLPDGQYIIEYRIPQETSGNHYQLFFILNKGTTDHDEIFSISDYQGPVVGIVDQYKFPYVYTSETGDYTGIDVEIFHEIAKRYRWNIDGYTIGNTTGLLEDFVAESSEPPIDCFIGIPDQSPALNSLTLKTNELYTDESGTHYFYVDTDFPELLESLNNAITAMKTDGSIDRIRDQFKDLKDFTD